MPIQTPLLCWSTTKTLRYWPPTREKPREAAQACFFLENFWSEQRTNNLQRRLHSSKFERRDKSVSCSCEYYYTPLPPMHTPYIRPSELPHFYGCSLYPCVYILTLSHYSLLLRSHHIAIQIHHHYTFTYHGNPPAIAFLNLTHFINTHTHPYTQIKVRFSVPLSSLGCFSLCWFQIFCSKKKLLQLEPPKWWKIVESEKIEKRDHKEQIMLDIRDIFCMSFNVQKLSKKIQV